MEVRTFRASAVVAQRVPATLTDWFMEWQTNITSAAERFSGYRGTDIYPPTDNQINQWVVVIHFEDEKSLQDWLGSTVRAQWVDELQKQVGDFGLKVLPGGFGSWFASLVADSDITPPPSWKMALTVLLGLYPTVMLLTLFPGPYSQPLGLAVAMLIGNSLSVAILQWGVMPALNRLLASWLKANSDRQRVFSFIGLALIIALLVGLAFLFRQITG